MSALFPLGGSNIASATDGGAVGTAERRPLGSDNLVFLGRVYFAFYDL